MMIGFLLLATSPLALGTKFVSSQAQTEGDPVSRVVQLLKDLQDKLEKEFEEEKDMYETFVCWGKKTLEQKSAAMLKANERIDSLTTYIADIDAGKVWFTGEKSKTETELAGVHDDIKNISAMHNETDAFIEKQINDTGDAITGTATAIDLIKKAAGGFLQVRASEGQTAMQRLQLNENIKKALKVGDQYLSKANALFLRRILTGEVNKDFEMAEPSPDIVGEYKSRNSGIVDILQGLQGDFQKELKAKKEEDAAEQKNFEKAHALKDTQRMAVEKALQKLQAEYAARNNAKEEGQAEIDALKEQNTADDALIKEVTAALTEQQTQWDQRSVYRAGEMEAVGKAIEILHSDEARDLFASSTASFLQLSATSKAELAQRARAAGEALRAASDLSKDRRLLIVASMVQKRLRMQAQPENPTFDVVLLKIDEMKKAIDDEEEADLGKKENCESTKTQDLADKTKTERNIEDLASKVGFLESKIKETEAQIEQNKAKMADISGEMQKATDIRTQEAAEFAKSKAEDEAAIALVDKAAGVVEGFYANQKTAFLQISSHDSSDLPEDAPKGFKENYGGAGAQSGGVVQTMKMVSDDMRKEIAVSEKEEVEAIKLYEDTQTEMAASKQKLSDANDALTVQKGDKETDKTATTESKGASEGELAALLQKMKDMEPECKFYVDNYEARNKNRLIELEGLDRAKAILKGSLFEDKGRELGVGDS